MKRKADCFEHVFFRPWQRMSLIFALALLVMASGCHIHKKPKRGVLLRGDWALEINRTPWIGDSAESYEMECCEESPNCTHQQGGTLFGKKGKSCLPKMLGRAGNDEWQGHVSESEAEESGVGQQKALQNRQLSQNGMPGQPGFPMAAGATPGLMTGTPNVTGALYTQTPPAMTPLGTPVLPVVAGQPHYLPAPGTNGLIGQLIMPTGAMIPGARLLVNGNVVAPNGLPLPATNIHPIGSYVAANGSIVQPGGAVLAPSGNYLVAPPAAQQNAMMLAGGMLPAGSTAGMNAVAANGLVMSTGPGANGMINPAHGEPVPGLTMSGYPQVGYPPIGYAKNGYSPGHAQPEEIEYVAETEMAGKTPQGKKEKKELVGKSSMPTPRHHPVPTKPVFERTKGMVGEEQATKQASAAKNESDAGDDRAERVAMIRQAYMTGMVAAMRQQQAQQAAMQQRIVPVNYNMPANPQGNYQAAPQATPYGASPYAQSPYYRQASPKPGLLTNPLGLLPQNSNAPILGFLGLAKNEQQPQSVPQQHAASSQEMQAMQHAYLAQMAKAQQSNIPAERTVHKKVSQPVPDARIREMQTDETEEELRELLAVDTADDSTRLSAPLPGDDALPRLETPLKPPRVPSQRSGVSAPLPPTIRLAGYELEE